MRVELHAPSEKENRRNAGLLPPPTKSDPPEWQEDDPVWKACRMLDQLERMEESKGDGSTQVGVSATFGKLPTVPWLDKIVKENCERELEEAKIKAEVSSKLHLQSAYPLAQDTSPYSSHWQQFAVYGENITKGYLIIELPNFDVPVMHEETFYPVPQNGPSGSVTPLDLALYKQKTASGPSPAPFNPLQTIPFLDYENENDNPVEDKYRTLAHDLLRGLVDPALKPDRVQRDRLAAIIASPSYHPTREEKGELRNEIMSKSIQIVPSHKFLLLHPDLLWRFRFSLVDNRRALTKFLLAVDWTVESEVVQAAELLEQWRRRSPIEVTDALKLLGKQVAYQTNLVRAYAIDTLASAPDGELSLYLLQLVQALKFENIQETGANQVASSTSPVSSLATFLVNRAAKNMELANHLYW
jgi:phosphatidylinositol 3-kinase